MKLALPVFPAPSVAVQVTTKAADCTTANTVPDPRLHVGVITPSTSSIALAK